MATVVLAGRRSFLGYDAEDDIGLVAGDSSDGTATTNATRLSSALESQWHGGSFSFQRSTAGPVLLPIVFKGKQFYFKGPIKTGSKIGGAMFGVGSRTYSAPDDQYGTGGGLYGGVVTRLIRTDGGAGGPIIRLRGTGFRMDGFDMYGQMYTSNTTLVGTPAEYGIEVEGRDDPSSGKHSITNCGISFCGHGIRAANGYYTSLNSFVALPTTGSTYSGVHADETIVDGVTFAGIGSCFRMDNEQSVQWCFNNIYVGGSTAYTPVLFDYYRSGKMTANNITINHPKCTILKVHHPSSNYNHYDIRNFWWDNFEYLGSAGQYLTMYKNTYTDSNAGYIGGAVRMSGHIANSVGYYDESRLIEFDASLGTASPMPYFDELLFDVTGMPTVINGRKAFSRRGNSPWYYPHQDYWAPAMKKNWVISSGAVYASEPDLRIDTEGASATDDLDYIYSGFPGKELTLRAENSGRTVVVKTQVPNVTNLISYWKLDEVSGTRYDSHGTNHLTPTGTHTQAEGKIFRSASFLAADAQFMIAASNSGLQIGNNDATFSLWTQLNTKPSHAMTIFGKFSATNPEHQLYWDNTVDKFKWQMFTTASSYVVLTASVLGTPALNTWYHLVVGHDSTTDKLFMYCNNVAETEVSFGAAGVYSNASAAGNFTLNQDTYGGIGFGGLIDEFGYWKGTRLSTLQISDLYNSGSGQEYPFAVIAAGRPGNIRLGSDYSLDDEDKSLTVRHDGAVWRELGRV